MTLIILALFAQLAMSTIVISIGLFLIGSVLICLRMLQIEQRSKAKIIAQPRIEPHF